MAEIVVEDEKKGASSVVVRENGGSPENHGPFNRKEKRKEAKKMKRKRLRKELAAKEREEEEARLNDPEEQAMMRLKEQEEAERAEKERKLFEEREAMWLEAATKAKEEAERKRLEESQSDPVKCENELTEDDSWEYIEEGPAEIIWQGNEIIVKKKKVRVPKRSMDKQLDDEVASRPTSNPLPPQSAAFDDYRKTNTMSAQVLLDSVAQQTPNFGTEQDKAHCPFHFKTGACRFGPRCSRVHFYPDKSCTLLIKNMYNGPGLAWEQDEGLEYTEEEVEGYFEEFYEDVHTEFLKYGQIVNFKITCEFVGVTRWKVAICGEYMKSRHKTCSRGSACNFIHCFRNPGGDYEWADWDKLPPRYWVEKMVALFGPSARDEDEEKEKCEDLATPRKTPRDSRHYSPRSKSRDRKNVNDDYDLENLGESGRFHHRGCSRKGDYYRSSGFYKSHDNHMDDHEQSHRFHDWSGSSDGENSDDYDRSSNGKYSKRKAYNAHGCHLSRGVEAHHTEQVTSDLGHLDSDTEYSDKYDRHSSRTVHHHHRRSGSIRREDSLDAHSDDFDHSPVKGRKNSGRTRGYPEEDGHSILTDHSSWERRHHRNRGSSRRNETWSSDTEGHNERWNGGKPSSDGTHLGSKAVRHCNNVTSNCGMVSSEENRSRDDTESQHDTHYERHHHKHQSSSRDRKRERTEASWKKRNNDIEDSDYLKPEKGSSRRRNHI
ncbi:unnamed protein product [Victoria cruziana]